MAILDIVTLSVVYADVITLSVIILSVVMLSVVGAKYFETDRSHSSADPLIKFTIVI
jgi:hypothetical protein